MKGEVSKSGQAILPSKRSRKVPASNIKADDKVVSEDDDFADDNIEETESNEMLETNTEEQSS